MANHFSILALRTPWTVWKGKKIWHSQVSRYSIFYWVLFIFFREDWRNSSRKNEDTEPKQKQHAAVEVTGDGGKVWCCKEQYLIGIWTIRSINHDKLEVVKQEMARVNINILGINELKWTRMGKFNSDDHYIYTVGKNPLEGME